MGDKATGAFATPLADGYQPKTGPDSLRPGGFPTNVSSPTGRSFISGASARQADGALEDCGFAHATDKPESSHLIITQVPN